MLTMTTEPMGIDRRQPDTVSDVTHAHMYYTDDTLSPEYGKWRHSAVLVTMLMAVASVVMTTVAVSNLTCFQCDDDVTKNIPQSQDLIFEQKNDQTRTLTSLTKYKSASCNFSCLHGGSCWIYAAVPNQGFCDCIPGYFGANCQLTYSQMVNCDGVLAGVPCPCQPGYTGYDCAQVIDNCASQPCQNTTNLCQNYAGGYFCYCPQALYGYSCATPGPFCKLYSIGGSGGTVFSDQTYFQNGNYPRTLVFYYSATNILGLSVQYGTISNGWALQHGTTSNGNRIQIDMAAGELIKFVNVWVSSTGNLCRLTILTTKATYGPVGSCHATNGQFYYLARGLTFVGGKDTGSYVSALDLFSLCP